MPLFDTDLEPLLKTCDDQIAALITDLQEIQLGANEAKRQLDEVKKYFHLSLFKTNGCNEAEILASYELFLKNLAKVRNGSLTTEEALTAIQDNTDSREMGIIFYNIGKIFELMFWTLATIASACAAISVGLPLIFIQPFLGLPVTLGAGGLAFLTFTQMDECLDEFKSCDRLAEEDEREKNLVSFFKPAPAQNAAPVLDVKIEEQADESKLMPV